MQIITFFNHAGGASKTSSVRDLGYLASEAGLRVLLLDLDPQASLSRWLGADNAPNEQTVMNAILDDNKATPLPKPLEVFGMHLIPSGDGLRKLEGQLYTNSTMTSRLKRLLRQVGGSYDLVLIDTPPSTGLLTQMALIAAQGVVVPVPVVSKGAEGIPTVQSLIEDCQEMNPSLEIKLFLLTQYNPQIRVDQEAYKTLKQLEALAPVSTPITFRKAPYGEAQAIKKPIPISHKGEAADRDIRHVALEFFAVLGLVVRG